MTKEPRNKHIPGDPMPCKCGDSVVEVKFRDGVFMTALAWVLEWGRADEHPCCEITEWRFIERKGEDVIAACPYNDLAKLRAETLALVDGTTPGPWSVFINDAGDNWTGWPLSINADDIVDKTIIRPGGHWPYEWDAKTSQYEACQNARLIAAAPTLAADTLRLLDEIERLREALRFYANPDVYKPHPSGPAFDDRDLSFLARAALSKGTPDDR